MPVRVRGLTLSVTWGTAVAHACTKEPHMYNSVQKHTNSKTKEIISPNILHNSQIKNTLVYKLILIIKPWRTWYVIQLKVFFLDKGSFRNVLSINFHIFDPFPPLDVIVSIFHPPLCWLASSVNKSNDIAPDVFVTFIIFINEFFHKHFLCHLLRGYQEISF